MIVDLSLKMLMCVKYTFSQSMCVNLSLSFKFTLYQYFIRICLKSQSNVFLIPSVKLLHHTGVISDSSEILLWKKLVVRFLSPSSKNVCELRDLLNIINMFAICPAVYRHIHTCPH